MQFKKAAIIFLLAIHNIMPEESFLPNGTWFSEKKDFRKGYEFLQLLVQDKKFIFAKLSYNEERKWEETRVLGVLEDKDGKVFFFPEMCTVFAAKHLGQRWILIQGFDCDHLKFQLTKNEQGIIISPSIGISESVSLKQGKSRSENTIDAIIVSEEKKIVQAWSLRMKYAKKGATASLNGKPVGVLETVDSTGSLDSSEFIRIGDMISINNPKASDFFE
ncbi:MAG TPA: hypothetical protein PLX69_17220 [Leptospiraceae bacterium]|nr:hypothetical protein [Leptospiraceae bacterium]